MSYGSNFRVLVPFSDVQSCILLTLCTFHPQRSTENFQYATCKLLAMLHSYQNHDRLCPDKCMNLSEVTIVANFARFSGTTVRLQQCHKFTHKEMRCKLVQVNQRECIIKIFTFMSTNCLQFRLYE